MTELKPAQNLKFSNSFVVLPKHCNYHYPMIFGGAFFSELDLCAASAVNRMLHDSECDTAVTHKFEGTFHAAAEAGDLIFIDAEIVELRHKSVVINVRAEREKMAEPGRALMATAKFVFVTKKNGEYHHHGLFLPQ